MIIKKLHIGPQNSKTAYALCNDDDPHHEIAYFDTLETAFYAVRYMNGHALTKEQVNAVIKALRKEDENCDQA